MQRDVIFNPNANRGTAGADQWPGQASNGSGTTSGVNGHATLSATADALEFNTSLGDFRLPRESVVRLNRGQFYPWLFRGFRIKHRERGVPEILQFCPLGHRSTEVLARLRSLGYPVG
jgi:hypothetical protein